MNLNYRCFLLSGAMAAALALGLASPANAISISVDSLVFGASNTPDFMNGAANNTTKQENRSSLQVLDAGGVAADLLGSSVSASTRYAQLVMADRDNNGPASRSATAHYHLTFTVDAPLGIVYDLEIDTLRLGALTSGDDSTLGTANVVLGAVNGIYSGPGAPVGGLNMLGQSFFDQFTPRNDSINQSNSLTIAGLSGPQVITLTFDWNASASSNGTTGTFGWPGDEAAMRLGISTSYTGAAAATYPGPGSRNAAGDGHFVNISATIVEVPEPSTYVLAGLSVLSFGAVALRRRRAIA